MPMALATTCLLTLTLVRPPAARPRATLQMSQKEVVVIGGGWAGYSAAESLSASEDCRVTLLEASVAGGLAGGWRTPGGRPVEAGIHGFWREYLNTFAIIDSLGLDRDQLLTPYTPSVLVSARGKVATAPVLAVGDTSASAAPLTPDTLRKMIEFSPIMAASQLAAAASSSPLRQLADLLPAPLDTALLADFAPSSSLSVVDRASAIGLLGAWADFEQEDAASWARYDDLSAEELFKGYGGVTPMLYEELVEPLLHVLPMAPGSDLSAAAALSCFHVFALQSRGAFDVRWGRAGLSESIFKPWQARLEAKSNVRLQTGARVASIERCDAADGDTGGGGLKVFVEGASEPLVADAVVLAVGATAAAKLTEASPALSALPSTAAFGTTLGGVTCVAVRLFLRPAATRTRGLRGGAYDSTLLPRAVAEAMPETPVLVCGPRVGNLAELKEVGFTVYDLQRMHDEHAASDECAVLEVDFYRADSFVDYDDDDVAALALRAAAAALGVPRDTLDPSMLVDRAVVRARRAVSHFAIGSAAASPGVRLGGSVYACGDWIDRCGHASWSTEKAVVTGRAAAAAIGDDLRLRGVDAPIIPAAADTAALDTLRKLARTVRASRPNELPPPAPWAAALK